MTGSGTHRGSMGGDRRKALPMRNSPEPAHGFSAARPLALGFAALGVLLAGALGWGATASISGSVIASGRVEAESRDQVVEHLDGGTVREILVANGDRVVAEAVLVRLEDGQLRSEEAILLTELAELVARRNRLEAEFGDTKDIRWDPELLTRTGDTGAPCREASPAGADCTAREILDGQRRLFEARRASRAGLVAQLRERITQTERQVLSLRAQAGAVDRQIGFLARELDSYRNLFERKVTRLEELMSREREAANLEGQAGDIGERIAAARSRIAEIELQILQIDAQRIEQAEAEAREVQARENAVRERLASVRERLARMEIRAPVAGEVFGMRVFAPAEVVRPGEAVLRILPADAALVVRGGVDPIHIDQVWRRQEATVLFPAFTQRTTPMFGGRVVRVAADASEDARTGLSWYEIEVAIGPAIEPEGDLSAPAWAAEAWRRTRGWIGEAWIWTREQAGMTSEDAVVRRPEREPSLEPHEFPPGAGSAGPMDDGMENSEETVRYVHAGGLALTPGMPAEIHLRTGERSPLSYLVKPLTDYFSRAFREE